MLSRPRSVTSTYLYLVAHDLELQPIPSCHGLGLQPIPSCPGPRAVTNTYLYLAAWPGLILIMSYQGTVVIGFGNSKGKLTSKIVEESYAVIERLGKKPCFTPPTIRPAQFTPLDMDHFKNIISQRRNQALLRSFLSVNDQDDVSLLYQLQEKANQARTIIDQQLKTTQVVAADLKLHKFAFETKTNEQTARQYLIEFEDNLPRAVEKFRERDGIVRKFSEKNKLSYGQAENILKENGYNAQLFD